MIATTLTICIAALLLAAAWRDLATRLIPDVISIGILGLGLLLRLPQGLAATLTSLAVALLLFTVLAGCAMRGWIGGGDVKLAAAVAAALPAAAVWDFVTATTVFGAVLALPYIVLGRWQLTVPATAGGARPQPGGSGPGLLGRVKRVERRRLRHGGPLPYAIAIAAAGILMLAREGS